MEYLHSKTTPSGGEALLLDPKSVLSPEDCAMLQALHSRSVGGIRKHLETLCRRGSGSFMEQFYVGYGHKSIGDCASITLFIEGVSMLAAKAIQDWPLYNGQESSTRYIDFLTQPFMNPVGTEQGKAIQDRWRSFYRDAMEPTIRHLMEQFPRGPEEDEGTYEKAIKARAFDILRGFLPAGAVTNLSWHGTIRQMADKLALLRHHPLGEVREMAEAAESLLIERLPHSFSAKRYEETEAYNRQYMREEYYYHHPQCNRFALLRNAIDVSRLPKALLETRPPKTELPKRLSEAGTLHFEFRLDYGSYRDIQRHRAVTQRMPLLTTELGFHPWYLDSLPPSLLQGTQSLLKRQMDETRALECEDSERQYYIAMGFNTSNSLSGGLPALVYLVELRATRFVHPTLRQRACQMAECLMEEFGSYGLVLHLDEDPDRFDIRRGKQDIVLNA